MDSNKKELDNNTAGGGQSGSSIEKSARFEWLTKSTHSKDEEVNT